MSDTQFHQIFIDVGLGVLLGQCLMLVTIAIVTFLARRMK